MPRKVEYWDVITRKDVRANRDKIFLFGDNMARVGFGGQAKEMRGEPNAVGIPTKFYPTNDDASFFRDENFDVAKPAIDGAIRKIPKDATVVIPKAGLGTGLAKLDKTAPKIFKYLNDKLEKL